MIVGKTLKVHGVGMFHEGTSKTLYLDIAHSEAFEKLNESFEALLKNFSGKDNEWPFVPHLTFGRIQDVDSETWEKSLRAIKRLASGLTWEFPVTEVIIYGADATQQPEYQEKLFTIPLHNRYQAQS